MEWWTRFWFGDRCLRCGRRLGRHDPPVNGSWECSIGPNPPVTYEQCRDRRFSERKHTA